MLRAIAVASSVAGALDTSALRLYGYAWSAL